MPARGGKQTARKAAPRPAPRRAFDRLWPWVFGGVVVLGVAVVAYGLRSRPDYPRAGVHWHAPYTVEICGRRLPPFPPSPGNTHTHGDGVIHVHPETNEEGRQATLRTFLLSVGVLPRQNALTLPDGRTYRDGDRCPDGRPGRWSVLVNGRRLESWQDYYPRDGDRVRFVFGPE
ncbi:MAG: hypothetical protein N0A24_00575 [Armatimonadetes bacterium]|nr:hypothetical protein [Armatimonadota bacterium]MDW8152716.1 hypothetical protein [Armatimonadota bacterium]